MKKLILILLLLSLLIISSCGNEVSKEPKIYVSIITHSPSSESGKYPDFINDEDSFFEHREGIVEFAKGLHDAGAKYNFQTEWNFLLAAIKYDKGTELTNGKNMFRYFTEDLGFEVDCSLHGDTYNYADCAYLFEQLGVEPSYTTGGFIIAPEEDCKIDYYKNPISGKVYTNYTWQAEVLWGGATYGHVDQEPYEASGVWKPKSCEEPYVNSPNSDLILVGSYHSGWASLNELTQKKDSLDPNKIYTITIGTGQETLTNEKTRNNFLKNVKSYANETSSGLINWVGIKEVANIWEEEYDSDPNVLMYQQ